MKKLAIAATAVILLASPSGAQDGVSPDDTRFRQLGECIAYFAVASGMDGKKEVPPPIASRISLLGGELMFEASVLGYDDDKAHTSVVEKLMEMNTVVAEQGTVALSSYAGMCEALVASLQETGN